MDMLPLQLREGYLFIESGRELWLLHTGAPFSFGASRTLCIAGEQFSIGPGVAGINAETISQSVKVPCAGLIGADILGRFDHIMDIDGGTLALSKDELQHQGESIPLTYWMEIPVVKARIGDRVFQMFFDTGAHVSYLQDASLTSFPPAGRVNDFYPSFGTFQTETYEVPVSLGAVTFTLQCGTLPAQLAKTLLMMSDKKGIVGNAILHNRKVGYFPRRRMLIL